MEFLYGILTGLLMAVGALGLGGLSVLLAPPHRVRRRLRIRGINNQRCPRCGVSHKDHDLICNPELVNPQPPSPQPGSKEWCRKTLEEYQRAEMEAQGLSPQTSSEATETEEATQHGN